MKAFHITADPMSQNELDDNSLRNLKELLGNKFPDLVETFLSDSERRLAVVRLSLQERDVRRAAHEIHALKGSCRNIGANPLAELCEMLERQAVADLIVDTEHQLAAIERGLASVSRQLRSFI